MIFSSCFLQVDTGTANSSHSVTNHFTYFLDLQKALRNGDTTADFELEYNAREVYMMKDASPRAWNDLLDRMYHDDKLFQVDFLLTKISNIIILSLL